jgi:hypothetical protein
MSYKVGIIYVLGTVSENEKKEKQSFFHLGRHVTLTLTLTFTCLPKRRCGSVALSAKAPSSAFKSLARGTYYWALQG